MLAPVSEQNLRYQNRCSSGFTWRPRTPTAPAIQKALIGKAPQPSYDPLLSDEWPDSSLARDIYGHLLRCVRSNRPLPTASQICKALKNSCSLSTVDRLICEMETAGFVRVLKRNPGKKRLVMQLRTGALLRAANDSEETGA